MSSSVKSSRTSIPSLTQTPPPAPAAPNVGRAVQGLLSHLLAAWIAFQLGVGWSSSTPPSQSLVGRRGCVQHRGGGSDESSIISLILRSFLLRQPPPASYAGSQSSFRSDDLSSNPMKGVAAVDTADFLADFASGFPWNAFDDMPLKGASQVLLVALSSRNETSGQSSAFFEKITNPSTAATAVTIPHFHRTRDAVSSSSSLGMCREVRQVVLKSAKPNAREAKSSRSCLVVVARKRSDSFLIQKWIQHHGSVEDGGQSSLGDHGWQMAGRYRFLRRGTNTLEDLPLSKKRDLTRIARDELVNYLTALEVGRVLERLQPIADRVAMAGSPKVQGTILVLTVNHGHADLFVNYVCAARAAHIDLDKILLVATDAPTYELATQLGVAAFFDSDIFANVPVAAAAAYGDGVYAKIMMSKAYCVHLLSMTGHNLLFQDVDIIPYQPNYLEWWIDVAQVGGGYDLVFQSDFSSRPDYAPWSANSGCYFAVNSAKTRYFFADMVLRGDSILKARSHQAPLHAVLSDHASHFGLRVRTLKNEASLLPMGYHFHRRPDLFRDPLFKNKTMSLHMNWNREKTSKKLFLEQMGDWHVSETCLRSSHDDGAQAAQEPATLQSCCVDVPAAICHYRDVPSVQNCDSSPALKSLTNGMTGW